jgi:DNA ligase-associated metallophosphoesterase
MASLLSHIIFDQHLVLSAERSMFWDNEKTLVVADLHVGKTGHFRKAGIGVPPGVYKDDLHRLLSQILFFKAEKLIITGDLTHSIANREMDLFRKWRKDFSLLDVHLVKGNHDILDNAWYEEADIHVHNEPLQVNKFLFVHDVTKPRLNIPYGYYAFSGHVHPGITIRGRGKQALRFPCFYFSDDYCILPAFSRFTGTYPVEIARGQKAFAVVEKELLPMQK